MRARTATVLILVLMAKGATASEEIDLQAVVKMFEERDLKRIQSTRAQAYEILSPEDRNRAALVAAKSLSINHCLGTIDAGNLQRHFAKPPAQDSPTEAECRRQWGINMGAAEVLRHLSEKRMIDDPAVLPYLIDALDHPDRSFVGQKCFYALKNLTYHESGDAYWGRMVEDAKRHDQVLSWWRDWWAANKNKHAVFDREVEERARILVLDLANTIETELKSMHRQLSEFSVPAQLPLHSPPSPLFDIEFNPSLSASISLGGTHRDQLPWLNISSQFQTSDLAEPPDWQRREERLPPLHLRDHVTRALYCQLDGTDIAITVKVATTEVELVKSIRRALKKYIDTQPGVVADGHACISAL